MNKQALQNKLQHVGKRIVDLRMPLFFLLLVTLYGFIVWRANSLTHVQPDPTAVTAQSSPTVKLPHIDQTTISKIKQLQDNSVNVQTLFDQARQNPFKE